MLLTLKLAFCLHILISIIDKKFKKIINRIAIDYATAVMINIVFISTSTLSFFKRFIFYSDCEKVFKNKQWL